MACRSAAAVAVAALLFVVVCAAAQAPSPRLPPNYHMINPGKFGKRDQQLTCTDSEGHQAPCMAKCDKRCPNQCIVMCPSCKTFCMCDFYPGASCGDPRFTGGDGNNFYFHGKKDQDFCIVSDANLHINAHFIGKRNPLMTRDFTWIQALGIRFADHRLYMGALKTTKWNNDVDRLELSFDGTPINVPAEIGAHWESAIVPGLTITRTAMTNGVRVQLAGVFDIMANVVPITEQDSRIHNYGVTEEDSLAHLDIGFKFYDLTDNVHGVLGQTYRSDYINKLSVSANMPVMGGTPSYVASDIFSTDCAVARFGQRSGISMRDQQLTCTDSEGHQAPCMAKCDKRCQCIVMCPSCKTFCMCDFYPGASCGDPRFTGGDGNNFYFHGKKDQNFCIVSDADLHINAHFIGKRNPTMSRDFTWIQALGIDPLCRSSPLHGSQENNQMEQRQLAFDGAPIDVPAELGAHWESTTVSGLAITRTTTTNAVRVQLAGVFDIMANVVPITEEDSRIHNYGVTEEDSLAHLDLGFKFYNLSEDVHGVLGQTYRSDYVNKLNVSANMPVMGGAPSYVASDIFSIDCAIARFGGRAGISMVTGRVN
uniref:Uncharacterized protein n=1 Tax=Leersia perrieri TaxID=77586 RepID=A0A0D9VAR9_9ORYZ